MDTSNHPCFSEGARHRTGRIHLPVAPRCNMQCNYCNRDFECVNESRPGVSTAVIKPHQAADYLDEVLTRIPQIAVVGIAGPGDPFANAFETMSTLRLVRKRHPDILLCLATNGLELAAYVDELADLRVGHVTVTVNAVDETIGEKIYAWARQGPHLYRGIEAARVLRDSQFDAIAKLKDRGVTVKINSVIIPGINDHHIEEVARTVARMKADIFNAIPMYHVEGTPFAHLAPLPAASVGAIREAAGVYLPQMAHCSRCRADAAGLLGQTQSDDIRQLLHDAAKPKATRARPYVAVASREGLLVNQHLGEASGLWIFGRTDAGTGLIDRRPASPPGGGVDRWEGLARTLSDCGALLCSGVGPAPLVTLEQSGLNVIVMEGLAKEGIDAVLNGREIPKILLKTPGRCGIGKQCTGSGTGCG